MRAKAVAIAATPTQPDDLASMLTSLFARLRQGWARRRTNLALADLDDRILDDIGYDAGRVRRPHATLTDWVVQSHSGTARLVFIGR